MSAAPDEDLQPLQITAAEKPRDTTHDRFPFQLGDDDTVLIGTRPKMALLLRVVGALSDDTKPAEQAMAFDQFLDRVLDTESVTYLRTRMEDPKDDLDLDHPLVEQMFRTLIEVWYGASARPTGGRRGSSAPPSRSGKRSTARSRSRV